MMNPTPMLFGLSHGPATASPQMYATHRLPAATHGGRRHRRNTSASVQSDSSYDYADGDNVEQQHHQNGARQTHVRLGIGQGGSFGLGGARARNTTRRGPVLDAGSGRDGWHK